MCTQNTVQYCPDNSHYWHILKHGILFRYKNAILSTPESSRRMCLGAWPCQGKPAKELSGGSFSERQAGGCAGGEGLGGVRGAPHEYICL